jgi:hypothetical protein
MATTAQRDELCTIMDYLHAHAVQVHYPPISHGQIERTESVASINSFADIKVRVERHGGWTVDCSQCVIALLGAVGLHVRDRDGFTGTLLTDPSLFHYRDPRHAYPGALAVFGPPPGHHVVMVRHRDAVHGNPVVFSQGQESDPRYLSLLSEAAGQPPPVTMLSIAGLGL